MTCRPASESSSAFFCAAFTSAAVGGGAASALAGDAGAPWLFISPLTWNTCGCEDLPSILTFVPAASISTEAMPVSATLSISSRISECFNRYLSDQLVAKQILGLGQLESRTAVVSVGLQHEQDVV